MGIVSVLAAALGSWAFGAVWYMVLSKPWMRAAGIQCDENGRPTNGAGALPFALSALCMLIVAGFMRHIFATSGIATAGAGLVSGLGVGTFFIAPWTMINNAYVNRPFLLTLIDGGYAIIGCGIIGLLVVVI